MCAKTNYNVLTAVCRITELRKMRVFLFCVEMRKFVDN